MLTSLTTSNFAIVKELSLEWFNGFSAITGETGAGKSISIDALAFCLGEKASPHSLRKGSDIAVVSAQFDIASLPLVNDFLAENGLVVDDDCVLRRNLNTKGRSKAFINGHSVTNAQLKEIGELLVTVHGQHAHQSLTKETSQRLTIDSFGAHQLTTHAVSSIYRQIKACQKKRTALIEQSAARNARKQLLAYQVNELNDFVPIEAEYDLLDAEHHRLAHGMELRKDTSSFAYALINSDEATLCASLSAISWKLAGLCDKDPSLKELSSRFSSACMDIEEASKEIRDYSDAIEVSPERLVVVEARISEYVDLSRKHTIAPKFLHETHVTLLDELNALQHSDTELNEIDTLLENLHTELVRESSTLTSKRKACAEELNTHITQSMQLLNMKGGEFCISITPGKPTEFGMDKITFLVSTNPGQDLQPIEEVASGGELSRMSLALQVAIAQKENTPTLIFDEVDVGISGNTAAIVGKLLRKLGSKTQVISITHLPQVASFADKHYIVVKSHCAGETQTTMALLEKDERINEIARLVGGEHIGEASRMNARQLIEEGTS